MNKALGWFSVALAAFSGLFATAYLVGHDFAHAAIWILFVGIQGMFSWKGLTGSLGTPRYWLTIGVLHGLGIGFALYVHYWALAGVDCVGVVLSVATAISARIFGGGKS